MSEEPRPGTTAAIDKRVEHLAEKVDGLELRMASVEQNQNHARELQALQFAAIQAGQTSVLSKLEGIDATMRARDAAAAASNVEAERFKSDPMATAAGKQIMDVVTDVTRRTAGIERKLYIAGGAIALVIFAANLLGPVLGPLIRQIIGIP